MTLLAEHIPSRSPVVSMSYSQSPDPIVWLVHNDGTWSGFTYDRENNVTAWHRHWTGTYGSAGSVASICTLYSSNLSDSLIFLVDREPANALVLESIDGAVMQTAMSSYNLDWSDVDIGDTPAIYCDSHISKTGSFDGTNTLIQNLATVNAAFANGTKLVVANQVGESPQNTNGTLYEATVATNGSFSTFIQVPGNYATGYVIGIPFTAILIPNRTEIQLQDGSAQMRKWSVKRAAFRVFRSMNGYFQASPSYINSYGVVTTSPYDAIIYTDMDEYPMPFDFNNVSSVRTKTGQTLPQPINFDWNNALDIVISSRHPTPFNILGMILEIEVEGTSGAGT